MNKLLKFFLLGMAGAIGLMAAGVAYLTVTFNPNDYKAKIIQTVKETKQRTLHLDGDIKLSFFPNIGANLSKVSLSELNSDKEFAAIASARVSLALLPLLRKQVVVDEVAVSGLQTTLIKREDGTSNIDDLLGQEGQPADTQDSQQVQFDIASVSVTNTNLTYRDESSGAQYAIKNLTLKTGRIANGVTTAIDLAMGIQANQPKLDITTQLQTKLTFELDKQQYRLQNLNFELVGSALDMSDLKVTASGDVNVDLAKNQFGAQKLTLNASGNQMKEKFSANLNVPALSMTDDNFSGENIALKANIKAAVGNIVAALNMSKLEGNAQSFKMGALTLDVDVMQPEQAFKVKTSGQVSGNFNTRQFNFNELNVAVNATGDKLPNKLVSSEMKGNVQIDALKQNVQANFAGGLLQSQIKAKLGVSNFSQPAIKFDVELDQLDADLYLPKRAAGASPQPTDSEMPLDLSGLRKLNIDGGLRIGALKVMNVKSSELRVDVQAKNGMVNVNPLSANLYQGHVNGSLNINAQAMPMLTINQSLSGVDIASLGKDAANFDTLEGKGNVGINLALQGNTVSEMKKSANGSLSLNLADGAIRGINIAKKIRDVKSALGAKSQSQAADKNEKTDFSELKASFKVTNGIAHNDDLSMKSPLLRLSGSGDINLGNDSINYLAKASLVKTLEGQGGQDSVRGVTVPVRVSGPFIDLKYGLDFNAMVSDEAKQKVEAAKVAVQQKVEVAKEAAKQKIEEKKEEVKMQIQDQLKNSLKGLFK
ncbi:MAG: AsmA family protein [Gallionella sp.]|nr:AsmA family protein [Gallionella sp.]